jgi:hypothetical protein
MLSYIFIVVKKKNFFQLFKSNMVDIADLILLPLHISSNKASIYTDILIESVLDTETVTSVSKGYLVYTIIMYQNY